MRGTYRYKRMPRRRKRIYKRKLKLYRHFQTKSLGMRHLTLTDGWKADSNAQSQAWTYSQLYSFDGIAPSDFNERQNDLQTINNRLTTNVNDTTQKWVQFGSAQLDLTITNTGANTAEIDIYYYYVKRRTDNFSSPVNMAGGLIDSAVQIPDSTAKQNTSTVGTTPFDIPGMGRYIKIYKSQRVYLGVGNSTFVLLKDPKNHHWNTEPVISETNNTSFGERRMTQGVIIVFKGVNSREGGVPTGAPQITPVQLTMNSQRKYHYCQNLSSVAESGFN